MLEKLLELDRELLIYLNNLGARPFDQLWIFITNQFNWIPLFIFIFYVLKRKIYWREMIIIIITIAIMLLFVDQTTNLFKYTLTRTRPCADPDVRNHIRVVLFRKSFSFFSGHASNSMAVTTLLYFTMREFYKKAYWLFLFPFLFAYSRIYLGLHYPSDILAGYIWGGIFGWIFYRLFVYDPDDLYYFNYRKIKKKEERERRKKMKN